MKFSVNSDHILESVELYIDEDQFDIGAFSEFNTRVHRTANDHVVEDCHCRMGFWVADDEAFIDVR